MRRQPAPTRAARWRRIGRTTAVHRTAPAHDRRQQDDPGQQSVHVIGRPHDTAGRDPGRRAQARLRGPHDHGVVSRVQQDARQQVPLTLEEQRAGGARPRPPEATPGEGGRSRKKHALPQTARAPPHSRSRARNSIPRNSYPRPAARSPRPCTAIHDAFRRVRRQMLARRPKLLPPLRELLKKHREAGPARGRAPAPPPGRSPIPAPGAGLRSACRPTARSAASTPRLASHVGDHQAPTPHTP